MLKRYALLAALVFYGCGLSVTDASAQTVTKETLPGVTNFAKLDTTIACAGATTPQAVAGLKQMGYASIINLREASEEDFDILLDILDEAAETWQEDGKPFFAFFAMPESAFNDPDF